MYQLTSSMQHALRRYLNQYHELFDSKGCSGLELEELIFKAIQSDRTSRSYATWRESGRSHQANIRVEVNGKMHPLQIRPGDIKRAGSGDARKPHLVVPGYRSKYFENDLKKITEHLNNSSSDILSVLYRKLQDDKGGYHNYQFLYVENMYLRQLNPNQWERAKSNWRQTNPYGVIFTICPPTKWQIWWRIPLSLVSQSEEFRIR